MHEKSQSIKKEQQKNIYLDFLYILDSQFYFIYFFTVFFLPFFLFVTFDIEC